MAEAASPLHVALLSLLTDLLPAAAFLGASALASALLYHRSGGVEPLRAIAPRAFLIMDEAHNAGGSAPASEDGPQFKSKGAPPRSDVFREVVDKAHSVM